MSGLDRGRLNKRVTIEAPTRQDNGQGGEIVTWDPLPARATVWAEIIGLSGDEALMAGVLRGVQQWRVTIGRRDEVTPEHRLTRPGQVYEIKSAMPDPKSEDGTVLICETGTASAP